MTEYFEVLKIDKIYIVLSTILKGIAWICVIFAVSMDLYHGIRKSKEVGEFTMSGFLFVKRLIKRC